SRLFRFKLEGKKRKLLNELNWANVFNSAITDSPWLKNKSFNPGRWAAGYPMLYVLYRIYNDIKPKAILEMGLGESTKLAYQYKNKNTDASLVVIEQDGNWLNFFSNEIYDIKADTILLPLEKRSIKGYMVKTYKGLTEALPKVHFNLIVVDG